MMREKDPVTAASCNYFVLGSLWGRFGIVLGSFGDRFGIVLESFWDRFGIVLGSFWDRFWGGERTSPKICQLRSIPNSACRVHEVGLNLVRIHSFELGNKYASFIFRIILVIAVTGLTAGIFFV